MNGNVSKRLELLKAAADVVVPYSEAYSTAHKVFARRMWPNKKRRQDEAYVRWKFRGPRQGPVEGCLLAVIDDRVVGQLGLIPVKLRTGACEVPAQWACDLMVDPSMRQKGIGSMLFAVAMNREMVTLGSDPSKLADITMARIGFRPLQGPAKMVLPLELKHTLPWVIPARLKTSIPWAAAVLQPLWSLRTKKLSRKDGKIVRLGSLTDVVSCVESRQAELQKPHIVHDRSFLSWRYGVITRPRIETLISDAGGYAICEATPAYFYVYDWHAPRLEAADAILAKILELAIQAKSQTISIYANDPQEKAYLERNGYLEMRTPLKVIYYPQAAFPEDQHKFHYCLYDSDGNI